MATWVDFFAMQVSENKHRPKVTVKLGFMTGVQMMMIGSYCWQTSFLPGWLSLEATLVLLKHAAAWTHAHSNTHKHPDRKAVRICGVRSICCFNRVLKLWKPSDCYNQSCIVLICNLGLYLIGLMVRGAQFLISRSQESTLNQEALSTWSLQTVFACLHCGRIRGKQGINFRTFVFWSENEENKWWIIWIFKDSSVACDTESGPTRGSRSLNSCSKRFLFTKKWLELQTKQH